MLGKLAIRNMKRQTSAYVIYFITVVIAVALMFAIDNVLFAEELWNYDPSRDNRSVINILIMFIVLVTLVVGFIICYATAFLLRKRKQEFGTYLLLGMKRSSVLLIFVIENLLVGVISFAVGCALGIGVFQALNAVICAIIGNGLQPLSMTPGSLLTTLLQWAGILFVAVIFSAIKLRRAGISELINSKAVNKKLPKHPLIEKSIALFMLLVIAADGAFLVTIISRVLTPEGWGNGELFGVSFYDILMWSLPIGLGILMAAVFICHFFLRGIYLRKLQGKKTQVTGGNTVVADVTDTSGVPLPKVTSAEAAEPQTLGKSAYKGANVFHYRQMSASMNRNAAIMGIIGIMITLAIMLTNLTFSMRFVMLETVKTPFDVVGQWRPGDADSIGSPEEASKEAHRYADTEFELIFESYKPDEAASEELQFFDVVRRSDINALLSAIDSPVVEIESDEFYLLCSSNTESIVPDGYDKLIREGETKLLYDKDLRCAGAEKNSISYAVRSAMIGGYLVVDDSVISDTVRTEYCVQRNLVINTSGYLPSAFASKYSRTNDYGADISHIKSVFTEIDYINVSFSVAIVSVMFLAVTFMLIALALLSLKAMADADLDIKRYAILNMLGVDVGRQRKLMFRQLLIFFAAPLVIPLLMTIPTVAVCAIISAFALGSVHPAIFGIGIAAPLVFIGLYICYFAATYYLSVKSCIKPLERSRVKLLAKE